MGGEAVQRVVDEGVGVLVRDGAGVLEPALGQGRDEQLQGDARVDVRADVPGLLGGAQPVDVQLERWFEQLGDESAAEFLVDDAFGGQGAGGGLEGGVAQFVDRGAQHLLEVGGEVAGVRDGVRQVSGGARGLLAQVEEGLQEHVRLRSPPPVDRLLADAGAGGDALDGRPRVADLDHQCEGGVIDGAPGALAAAGGVRCGLVRGRGVGHGTNLSG
ncbi:hypothetical protein GCM10010451_44960 [Streptomyces virens]|uniref:Uncharacterized protein n=1 Tax=Streptomyces virens TaxID=285572 RepID=A0ABP6PTR2_9ACTN